MGEEAPLPGRTSFQAMLFSLLHSMGRFGSAVTPSPSGPRQHGQSAADTVVIRRLNMEGKIRNWRIIILDVPHRFSPWLECVNTAWPPRPSWPAPKSEQARILE